MRVFKYHLLVILIISVLNCGSNLGEKGRQAYHQGDYNQAIQFLTAAKSQENIENGIDEIIVLAYMYRGHELFQKTKNLKSFTGNYTSALKYLPKNTSDTFRTEYNDLLVELARAYKDSKPSNEREEENNFTKSIALLEEVLKQDSNKAEAIALSSEIEELIFQKYLEKSESLYTKARKTKNWDLLFTAESYLLDAEKLNNENKQLKALKQNIRRETLGVLNYREGISLAVTKRLYEKGKLIMYLAVKNYKNQPVNFNPESLELVDMKGTKYSIDKEEMRVRELFGQNPIKLKKLDATDPYTEGMIAFEAPENLPISHLALNMDGNEVSRKYFR